jgi:manganese/zinc-transporting P-type ATPase C
VSFDAASLEATAALTWEIVSVLPGRIRLRTDRRLAGAPACEWFAAAVGQLPAVRETRLYSRTGNLVVWCTEEQTAEVLAAMSHPETLPEVDLAARAAAAAVPVVVKGHDPHGRGHDNGHEHGHDHSHDTVELADFLRLFAGGAVLLLIGLRRLRRPMSPILSQRGRTVTALVTLFTGYPFFRSGLRSFTGKAPLDTDALISVATLASLALRENTVALVVLWLLNIGEFLQALVLRRTRRAIAELVAIGEPEVWLVSDETEIRVPLLQVQPEDHVVVYAHHKIPVDGEVVEGTAAVNESPITGEALPVSRSVGDWVFAGTLVEAGRVRIEARRVGQETALARLIQRVEEAAASKAPIEVAGQRFARKFVPASFLLAALVFLITRDPRRSMTMLVIACPCAAGLATPTAISAAIGSAARYGVLIKGGTHLEMAGQISVAVFDKTGTLTMGRPRVAEVVSLHPEVDPMELLQRAASAELHSEHPIGKAVVRHATEQELTIPPHEECEVLITLGVRADAEGRRYLVGNPRLLDYFEVEIPRVARERVARYAEDGLTALYVAREQEVIGLLAVTDTIRQEAGEAISLLTHSGVAQVVMLTGDIPEAAAAIAAQLGITEFQARILPEEKLESIRRLQEHGHRVAMIGDGVNDAPALAIADLGIAMGATGSDVAIETADIALANNDLRRIAPVIQLGQRSLGIIRQNYAIAIGVNAGGILISALGKLNPFLAAVLHNLSSLLVVLNSARLIGSRLEMPALPPGEPVPLTSEPTGVAGEEPPKSAAKP